jgi:hypothetical protein
VIVTADSVTKPGDAAGKVLVGGSHGGIVSAWFAAQSGARAVILHDAGVGKDAAGIAGLAWLEDLGMAAAAVSHTSARIGDGADVLANGLISHANAHARALGVVAGMPCKDAAVRLARAHPRSGPVPDYRNGART